MAGIRPSIIPGAPVTGTWGFMITGSILGNGTLGGIMAGILPIISVAGMEDRRCGAGTIGDLTGDPRGMATMAGITGPGMVEAIMATVGTTTTDGVTAVDALAWLTTAIVAVA